MLTMNAELFYSASFLADPAIPLSVFFTKNIDTILAKNIKRNRIPLSLNRHFA
jgi:hypothetical protein